MKLEEAVTRLETLRSELLATSTEPMPFFHHFELTRAGGVELYVDHRVYPQPLSSCAHTIAVRERKDGILITSYDGRVSGGVLENDEWNFNRALDLLKDHVRREQQMWLR